MSGAFDRFRDWAFLNLYNVLLGVNRQLRPNRSEGRPKTNIRGSDSTAAVINSAGVPNSSCTPVDAIDILVFFISEKFGQNFNGMRFVTED